MSFANESASVRSFPNPFEGISIPLFFTSIHGKPKPKIPPINEESVEILVNNLGKEADYDATQNLEVAGTSSDTIDDEGNKENIAIEEKEVENHETKPIKSNVYNHLKIYPIANSWIKIIHWTPFPKIAKPELMRIAYSDSLLPYATSIDTYVDAKLTALDTNLPFVKTLRLRDIRNVILDDPIKKFAHCTTKPLLALGNLTNKIIIKPSRVEIQHIRDLRGENITFLGNQPIIRSQLNIFVKQINKRLIENITTYSSPPTEETNKKDEEIHVKYVALDENTNDFLQTVELVNLVILRSRPILQQKLFELSKKPSHFNTYVASVYQESRKHRGNGRIIIIIASLETIQRVASDGFEILSVNKFFEFLQSEPSKNKNLSIAEETIINFDDDIYET